MQLHLFGGGPPDFDRAFQGARRLQLGAGAWLEYVPNWLTGHETVLSQLLRCTSWEIHERQMYDRVVEVPRRVALPPESAERVSDGLRGHGRRIQVSKPTGSTDEVARVGRLLGQLTRCLSERFDRALSHVSLAHYRDGQDSVAPHGDRLGPLRSDTVVAICAVGVRRRFVLCPAKATTGALLRGPLRFEVGEGDLLVMGGSCQETFQHAVPKATGAGDRIAIMFRERLPTEASFESPVKKAPPRPQLDPRGEALRAEALPRRLHEP